VINTKRDLYEILEVSKTATADEIKKAYRKKALQYHPDRNPGNKESEEKFKEATEAYSILSDADSRAKFDQFGHAAFSGNGGGGPGGGFGGFQGGDFSGFEDIFGDIFGSFFGGGGGGGRGDGRPVGRDLRYAMNITFEEAAFGTEKTIQLQRHASCEVCAGSGAAKGSTKKSCTDCRGTGQTRIQQGFFTLARTCGACGGAGEVISKPCPDCRGEGVKIKSSKVAVKIPAGIDNGQRLKLREEGDGAPGGGRSGDLYVEIKVDSHPFFERQDADVICRVPISYSLAALGGEIDVPTLEGPVKLKIPVGTDSGKVFRLRNKGITVLGSNSRGDQHVEVNIEVPKKLSEERKELLQKLKAVEDKEVADKGSESGIFEKMKKAFGA
jgi:molecular chaperone DnaJ